MNSYRNYCTRLQLRGNNRMETLVNRTREYYLRKYPIEVVTFWDSDEPHEVFVVGTSAIGSKILCSLHKDIFYQGDIVVWKKSPWMITSIDARDDVYERFEMQRCNYLLKFTNKQGEIVEHHCVMSDVTKYLLGENSKEMLTIGDSRLSLMVQKNADTLAIRRGTRFILDDPDVDDPLCFETTKIDRVTGTLNNRGYFRFLVKETSRLPNDDVVEMVPDNSDYVPGTPDGNGGGWL